MDTVCVLCSFSLVADSLKGWNWLTGPYLAFLGSWASGMCCSIVCAGYRKAEAVGAPIAALMPAPFSQQHDCEFDGICRKNMSTQASFQWGAWLAFNIWH